MHCKSLLFILKTAQTTTTNLYNGTPSTGGDSILTSKTLHIVRHKKMWAYWHMGTAFVSYANFGQVTHCRMQGIVITRYCKLDNLGQLRQVN